MNMYQELDLKLCHLSRKEILLHMGYDKPNKSHFQRLESVLTDSELGLGCSHYDFKYSAEAFVIKLCSVAGIEQSQAHKAIFEIQRSLTQQKEAFKPYLFVDTGFKRASQPIFALAACEGQRYLHFDKDFWSVPLYDQLVTVYELIHEHMDMTQGFLGIWGYIRRYYFVYDDQGSAIEITPAGQIVAAQDFFQPSSMATLKHDGADILKVVGLD